jgi:hypothetical protein
MFGGKDAAMTDWKKTKLLIWGTTYPEFSKTYYETVCTGAVDGETGKLVRLYPITLRHKKDPFHHYDWVDVEVQRNPRDPRPESFRVQQEHIKTVDHLDTDDGWVARSEWVLRPSNVFESVEALWKAQEDDSTSLGLVKPKTIKRVYVEKLPDSARNEWDMQRENAFAQRDLFVDVEAVKKELVFMPVRYRIAFDCRGAGCKGRDMQVLDWGMYVLSRKMYAQKGGSAGAEKAVIAKINEVTDAAKKDAYFFLGNMVAHPKSFMVVGFYYPPLVKPTKAAKKGSKKPGDSGPMLPGFG